MSTILGIKKVSDWTFKTNATGGVGIGFFSGSGGLIELTSPQNTTAFFHYGGLGVGLSAGGRLPKIPKLPRIDLKGKSGNGSITDFTSYGDVYIMEGCKKDELAPEDFQAPCVYIDAGAGLIAGYSGTAMLAGVSYLSLLKAGLATGMVPGTVYDPWAVSDVMSSAQVLILMRGWNAAIQAGAGISISIGYLHLSKILDANGDCINNAKGFCAPATN